jgi:hypothetical protein
MRKIFLCAVVAVAMTLVSCNLQKISTAASHEVKSKFMNLEGDGSITVRAYGIGRYRGDALDQARKNAIRDVMLRGVYVPGDPQMSRPLILEVNAEEKYADFLYQFLADGGSYKYFTSREDRRRETNEKYWTGKQMKMSTTVRVLRPQLQQYLKENNIIK